MSFPLRGLKELSVAEREFARRFVARARQDCGRNLRAIVLYGSKARGDYTQHSGVDLLLLVRKATPTLRRRVMGWAMDCAKGLDEVFPSPQVMTGKLWGFERACRSLFYREVSRDGKLLWGTL